MLTNLEAQALKVLEALDLYHSRAGKPLSLKEYLSMVDNLRDIKNLLNQKLGPLKGKSRKGESNVSDPI